MKSEEIKLAKSQYFKWEIATSNLFLSKNWQNSYFKQGIVTLNPLLSQNWQKSLV